MDGRVVNPCLLRDTTGRGRLENREPVRGCKCATSWSATVCAPRVWFRRRLARSSSASEFSTRASQIFVPTSFRDEDHRTFLVSRCVLIVHAYYSHLAFSTHLGNADSSFIGWTSCSTAFLRNSFFLPSPVLGLVIGLHEVLNVGMRGVLVEYLRFL